MQKPDAEVVIAIMGITGTGKSTFINLITTDNTIHIGHNLESQTVDVNASRYADKKTGLNVMLVDTPGFDDSHENVTDTDILGKIADFLQKDRGRKINGIIYLHRISDPRLTATAKKNIRVFRRLCGDNNLDHVRIVTTFWDLVNEKEGKDREKALANSNDAFKPFIDAGAKMIRHDKGLESARSIIARLIHQKPISIQIQEELNAGRALGDTSAGAVIIEEMKELQKKHEKEMEDLKKELEQAADENERAEIDEDRQKLAKKIVRVEEDRKKLAAIPVSRSQRRPWWHWQKLVSLLIPSMFA